MKLLGFLDVLKIILYLAGFCSLLFLAYVTTRYIGRKQGMAMKGRNIRVLETVMIGADKRLHLVKAGKKCLLIATTAKSVECLAEVETEDEAEETDAADAKETETRFDFRSFFDKYAGIYGPKKRENAGRRTPDINRGAAEERSFRTNLEKLRMIINKNRHQDKTNGDENTNEKEKPDEKT